MQILSIIGSIALILCGASIRNIDFYKKIEILKLILIIAGVLLVMFGIR